MMPVLIALWALFLVMDMLGCSYVAWKISRAEHHQNNQTTKLLGWMMAGIGFDGFCTIVPVLVFVPVLLWDQPRPAPGFTFGLILMRVTGAFVRMAGQIRFAIHMLNGREKR